MFCDHVLVTEEVQMSDVSNSESDDVGRLLAAAVGGANMSTGAAVAAGVAGVGLTATVAVVAAGATAGLILLGLVDLLDDDRRGGEDDDYDSGCCAT
jgi:hypothetical protein